MPFGNDNNATIYHRSTIIIICASFSSRPTNDVSDSPVSCVPVNKVLWLSSSSSSSSSSIQCGCDFSDSPGL